MMAGTDVFDHLGKSLHRLASEMDPYPQGPSQLNRLSWWITFARRSLRDPFVKGWLRAALRIPVTEAQLPDLARVFVKAFEDHASDPREDHMRCVEAGLRAVFAAQEPRLRESDHRIRRRPDR